MGRRMVIAALVAVLTLGGPIFLSSALTAEAQAQQNAGCYCSASFDAIDSDLRMVARYYNNTWLNVPAEACGVSCDSWRRDWFYWNACDFPRRIKKGNNAWWGYDDGVWQTNIGPDTWWCPFPPP